MQNINLPTYILLAIGLTSVVFTIWNRITLNRHINHFPSRSSSSLADEKYFELRSKQEFIVAIAAVIVSLAAFLGYQGLQSIKEDLNQDLQTERRSIDSIKTEAKSALSHYTTLKNLSLNYYDTVKFAFDTLNKLNSEIKTIAGKNIIQQGIYIVEGIKLTDVKKQGKFYTITFNNLKTISDKPLPKFSQPPVVFITTSDALSVIRDITTHSLKIHFPEYFVSEDEPSVGPNGIVISLIFMSKQ